MPKAANKSIIAVDIDEVLMPHFQDLIEWYNQKYNTRLTLKNNHPTDPIPWGTTDYNEAIRRVQGFFETSEFKHSQPFMESIEAIKILNAKHELVIVTGRDNIIEESTNSWINKHYGKAFSKTYFTARYSLEGRSKDKADILIDIKAEYLIDDALHNCVAAAKNGLTALLFGDYVWNRAKNLPQGVVRVKGWQEVLEYFNGRS